MKKILLTVTGFIAVAMLFTGVGYAAGTWLNFTGDEQIKQSESDIDKIMKILEDVNSEKMTAKQALKELQELNLEEKNTALHDEVERLKTENAALNTEVANQKQQVTNKQEELNNKQTEIKQKEQEIQQKIEEGNRKVAEKQAELDGVVRQSEEHKRVAEELQKQINHLESELKRANEAAQSVSNKTTKALEQARTYEKEDVK